jgi:hypothetical protein
MMLGAGNQSEVPHKKKRKKSRKEKNQQTEVYRGQQQQ